MSEGFGRGGGEEKWIAAPPAAEALAEHGADPASVATVSLSGVLARGERDPMDVVLYLGTLGRPAATLEDIFEGIAGDPDEDELGARWAREGVLVSRASDGEWQLFVP